MSRGGRKGVLTCGNKEANVLESTPVFATHRPPHPAANRTGGVAEPKPLDRRFDGMSVSPATDTRITSGGP